MNTLFDFQYQELTEKKNLTPREENQMEYYEQHHCTRTTDTEEEGEYDD